MVNSSEPQGSALFWGFIFRVSFYLTHCYIKVRAESGVEPLLDQVLGVIFSPCDVPSDLCLGHIFELSPATTEGNGKHKKDNDHLRKEARGRKEKDTRNLR